jgi:two-component system OmpR family response regulator
MPKILMIEDDDEFAQLLGRFLAQYGMEVTTFADPYLGLSAGIESYDLLILDLTLPGMDGLEVCREVVGRCDIPIIISSARSDLNDKVVGLSIGADDYLPKPYDPQEMLARILSLLRRYRKIHAPPQTDTPAVRLDPVRETLITPQGAIPLTPAEFVVARVLFSHRDTTVSKEQILYDTPLLENSSDGSLSVIVSRLRKKLGSTATIKTVRGIGYRLIL